MSEKPIRYETQEIKTLKGLEAKSIEKMEKDGWELVTQDKGKLRTTLLFRKVKQPIPKQIILIGVAASLLLVTVISLGAIFGDKSSKTHAPEKNSSEKIQSTPAPKPSENADEILTVENNSDLKMLLSNSNENTYEFWSAFFEKYKGRTISFDGNVAILEKNPDFKYTYDALIEAGNYSENSSTGAPFRALRIVVPFGWNKTNQDDLIVQGTNLHVVARIWDFNEAQSFDIKLISTTVR